MSSSVNETQSETKQDCQEFIVTIDGPAGAGKSSVARNLASRFNFDFLDTGAMYRAVTLACLQANIDMSDGNEITRIANQLTIDFRGSQVLADGCDVSELIRTPEVNANIRFIADNNKVRNRLSELQTKLASGRHIVTEGRDQGTDVFPNAACKIFLTATPETRARRRHLELLDRGIAVNYEEVFAAQEKRDFEDSRRPVGALRPAEDAEVVFTDGMSQDEVVDKLAEIVIAKQKSQLND